MSGHRGFGCLLRQRSFRLLWSGETSSQLGNAVIGLFVGAWVDHLPARPLMISCDLVSLVLYASLPVAYWLGVLTFVQVLVVALLAGGCGVVFLTAYYVSGSSPLTVTCGGWPSLRRSTISGCLATWP